MDILSIFHVYVDLPAYPTDIPSLYQMGLFYTSFYNDMPMIYQVYSMHIQWIYLVYHWHIIIKKGTEQTHLV